MRCEGVGAAWIEEGGENSALASLRSAMVAIAYNANLILGICVFSAVYNFVDAQSLAELVRCAFFGGARLITRE